ncbi:MarR family transcriptional regulator [Parasphingopyxis sp.]|uniref:MarR family winged helix-turn-helix transcriptional regulator n=1 Tax=Parasphingopyxis sp. TaxID=1920299 RepID=UPI002623558B|nr:MarR family transcriptional regulator [Parasphingopyxis sp.]
MTKAKDPALAYLDLFFPIHYIVGMQIEDTLRSGVLTRQQACILWTIRVQGENGQMMRRKDIEKAMASWYEVTSSAISKSLRALTKPPLDLLQISEDPRSGREKLVQLTPRGRKFVEGMIRNGVALMDIMIDRLTDEEIANGIHFLTRVTEVYQDIREEHGDRINEVAAQSAA